MRFVTMHGKSAAIIPRNNEVRTRSGPVELSDQTMATTRDCVSHEIPDSPQKLRPYGRIARGPKACGLYTVDVAPGIGPMKSGLRPGRQQWRTSDFNSRLSFSANRGGGRVLFIRSRGAQPGGDGRMVQRQAFAGMLWSKGSSTTTPWTSGSTEGSLASQSLPKARKRRKTQQGLDATYSNEDVVLDARTTGK